MEFTEERLRFGRDSTIVLLGNQFTKKREEVFQWKTQPLGQGQIWVEYVLQMLCEKVTGFLPYLCFYGITHSHTGCGHVSRMLSKKINILNKDIIDLTAL